MATQLTPLEFPLCPKCAKPMASARTQPRFGERPEMNTYECQRCSIVFTEAVTGAASAPERASVLHGETYQALH
jgi:hypothetical protein